jgi:exodeoxyribonuclease VII large subunit
LLDYTNGHIKSRIYTVSELTFKIKDILEESFPIVWINGEISNFTLPASGHYYFNLKDDKSRISSVMFKGQNRKLTFIPENGMKVTCLGRISVYEPRGSYQLIIEHLEPKGIGSLQIAFEQLKTKLASEGLFDNQYKKTIPYIPNKISLITSPTGAVVHDIINIITRRYPNVHIQIIPVSVQGPGSVNDIVSALELINTRNDSEVIIIARGGGSFEDLSPFNSEKVARAVFSSKIPVISSVGHETDYTISDFVADLRAPTPSAAAELVLPVKDDLKIQCSSTLIYINSLFDNYLEKQRIYLKDLSSKLIDPKKKIDGFRLKLDDLTSRLEMLFFNIIKQKKENLLWRTDRLYSNNTLKTVNKNREKINNATDKLVGIIKHNILNKHSIIRELTGKLFALSPTGILERGYSITRTVPDYKVVKDPESVDINNKLEVLVAKGKILCRVEGKNKNGKKNI